MILLKGRYSNLLDTEKKHEENHNIHDNIQ